MIDSGCSVIWKQKTSTDINTMANLKRLLMRAEQAVSSRLPDDLISSMSSTLCQSDRQPDDLALAFLSSTRDQRLDQAVRHHLRYETASVPHFARCDCNWTVYKCEVHCVDVQKDPDYLHQWSVWPGLPCAISTMKSQYT